MLEHVDSVADNRIALGSSGRVDVLNRDRETRPTALVPVEVRKGQRNDDPLDNRERGEVEERVPETRPDALVDLLPACRRTQR